MRLSNKTITIILNVLLGAAWAATIYLFVSGFFVEGNFLIKLFNAIVKMLYGLFGVLVVEVLFRAFENSFYIQKMKKELEEINKKLNNKC